MLYLYQIIMSNLHKIRLENYDISLITVTSKFGWLPTWIPKAKYTIMVYWAVPWFISTKVAVKATQDFFTVSTPGSGVPPKFW